MPIPGMDVHYLRFVLHDDTDGILTAKKRENGSASDIPQADEIRDLLQLMAARGACKIRLTGDDPARRSDLCEVISLVSDIPGVAEIAMTTGGGALAGRVRDFARAGLRSINFDLDTLKAERYVQITGRDELPQVRAAMQEALDLGLRVKVNCMLQTGLNVDEIDAFVALTKDQLIEVRFIEWNTAADRIAPPEAFVPTTEAMARIKPPLASRNPSPGRRCASRSLAIWAASVLSPT
jgi:molybdenum cofactor biosynthesis enzyme MoaA